jgi:hypothetical protein
LYIDFLTGMPLAQQNIIIYKNTKEKTQIVTLVIAYMKKVLKVAVLTMVSLLTLTAVFLFTGNNNLDRSVIAQQTTQKFPVSPETAEQFADLIEGNDTAIILNDTNIGDVNNTVLDSIDVNIKEDCMNLPNSTVLYCP